MNDLIPIILFYFIYSFFMTIVKGINRKKTLKMLIDNNLIKSGETDIKLNFLTVDEKKSAVNYTLPVALGLMGFAFGLVCVAFITLNFLPLEEVQSQYRNAKEIKDAIQLGMPLFFAAIGVVIAYFLERRKQK